MIAESRTYPNWTDVTESQVYDPDWTSIAVVGEYTTNGGPWNDDHFLAVVQRDGEWYGYPTHLAKDIVPKLHAALGISVSFAMANRTDMASRIIYPPALAERPLLQWWDNYPRNSILGRIIECFTLGLASESTPEITDEVTLYLDGLTPGRTPSLTEIRAAAKAARPTYSIPIRILPFLGGAIITLTIVIMASYRVVSGIAAALLKRFA